MDSVLVDIENVVIMWWALQTIAIAYLKPGQYDLFLNVFRQPNQPLWPTFTSQSGISPRLLAYERWYRNILYNISGLKLM